PSRLVASLHWCHVAGGEVILAGCKARHRLGAQPDVPRAAEETVEEVVAGGGLAVAVEVDAAGVGKSWRRSRESEDRRRGRGERGRADAESRLRSHIGLPHVGSAGRRPSGGRRARQVCPAPVRGASLSAPRRARKAPLRVAVFECWRSPSYS